MQQRPPDTLSAVAKRHWRYFLGIWLFPVFVFVAWPLLPGIREYAFQYFFLLVTPIFFACNWMAQKPLRSGEVTKLQTVAIAVIAPFGIWCAVVLSFWGLEFLLRFMGAQAGE